MARKNSRNGLEEAVTTLLQNQTTLLQNQAIFQNTFLSYQAATDARFVRIEAEFDEIKAILLRHEQILQALPEAIRQKIGFKRQ